MPFIPWIIAAAIAGAWGYSEVTGEPDQPVTVTERATGRKIWAVAAVVAILGGVWLWKR